MILLLCFDVDYHSSHDRHLEIVIQDKTRLKELHNPLFDTVAGLFLFLHDVAQRSSACEVWPHFKSNVVN